MRKGGFFELATYEELGLNKTIVKALSVISEKQTLKSSIIPPGAVTFHLVGYM